MLHPAIQSSFIQCSMNRKELELLHPVGIVTSCEQGSVNHKIWNEGFSIVTSYDPLVKHMKSDSVASYKQL